MRQIPLSHGQFALVDNKDFTWLNDFKWYYHKDKNENTGYAVTHIKMQESNGKRAKYKVLRMHRMIMNNPLEIVDHKDGNGLNNQRSNLRIATRTQNLQNRTTRGKNNSSGYKGIYWNKREKRWYCSISYNGKDYGGPL